MKRVISIVVALAVAAIAFLGWIDRPISFIGGSPLQRSNDAYLTKSFTRHWRHLEPCRSSKQAST